MAASAAATTTPQLARRGSQIFNFGMRLAPTTRVPAYLLKNSSPAKSKTMHITIFHDLGRVAPKLTQRAKLMARWRTF